MKKILFILGIILLCNAIVLLFTVNYHAGYLVQGIIAAALIAYALLFDRFSKKIHITAGILCSLPLLFMAFLGIYGNIGSTGYDEDVVIVLGAGIRNEQPGLVLAGRLDKAAEYHKKNPEAVIVVCGGLGAGETIAEAAVMKRYLTEKGVPKEQILLEDRSATTYENLKFAAELLDGHFPRDFSYSAVLITSDFHMFRAVRIAKQAGITAKRLGAPIKWYTIPANYSREVLAIGKMLLSKG
jgi:uncharacterized SAM-binding protein YcdF (DUF218 family)